MLHADEMATIWVVRGGPRDRLVSTFLDEGEIGVVFPQFPDGHDVDRAKALRILGVGLDDEPTKHQEHDAALFLSFVRRIEEGDIAMLVDPHAGGFACGVVTGDYRYRTDLPAERAQHRRPVEWRRRLPFASLPGRLDHLPDQRAVLEDVPDGRLRDLALQCTELRLGDDPFDRPAAPVRSPRTSAGGAPRRPRTPKPPAPKRPSQATRAERRCTVCLVTKADDLFDDGDVCRDCA
jgi:hypothetical protein